MNVRKAITFLSATALGLGATTFLFWGMGVDFSRDKNQNSESFKYQDSINNKKEIKLYALETNDNSNSRTFYYRLSWSSNEAKADSVDYYWLLNNFEVNDPPFEVSINRNDQSVTITYTGTDEGYQDTFVFTLYSKKDPNVKASVNVEYEKKILALSINQEIIDYTESDIRNLDFLNHTKSQLIENSICSNYTVDFAYHENFDNENIYFSSYQADVVFNVSELGNSPEDPQDQQLLHLAKYDFTTKISTAFNEYIYGLNNSDKTLVFNKDDLPSANQIAQMMVYRNDATILKNYYCNENNELTINFTFTYLDSTTFNYFGNEVTFNELSESNSFQLSLTYDLSNSFSTINDIDTDESIKF